MKLIYIKSTITPKDYSIVREILKKERGEKLAPFIYKLSKLDSLKKYLDKEDISYEVYQSIKTNQKEKLREKLIAGYKASAKSKKFAQEDEIWDEAIADGLDNE
ncbi:MAG: hypothetical protein I3273_07015 [Candidatus Moeniiplasma glomeromycotorum]|nr:hypothetical protein [Candidatus Moeniiplasma glomeromycotorum]MCE8168290.1 hypothetical protein [Candidatus Moeniiplasma glomeromycotorum]MCE8169837.1 hypothetical protein [Candidatus Moeniiplasma glomeromycotorum]